MAVRPCGVVGMPCSWCGNGRTPQKPTTACRSLDAPSCTSTDAADRTPTVVVPHKLLRRAGHECPEPLAEPALSRQALKVIPALVHGVLPVGRYACTPTEVHDALVAGSAFMTSSTRRSCFDGLEQVRSMIERLAPGLVESAWVGGSFATDRLDPDDVDVTFVLDHSVFDSLPPADQVSARRLGQGDLVRRKTGLRVDVSVMVRERYPSPWQAGMLDPASIGYFSTRGAWDDWWQRSRSSADPSMPARGYLEVIWT